MQGTSYGYLADVLIADTTMAAMLSLLLYHQRRKTPYKRCVLLVPRLHTNDVPSGSRTFELCAHICVVIQDQPDAHPPAILLRQHGNMDSPICYRDYRSGQCIYSLRLQSSSPFSYAFPPILMQFSLTLAPQCKHPKETDWWAAILDQSICGVYSNTLLANLNARDFAAGERDVTLSARRTSALGAEWMSRGDSSATEDVLAFAQTKRSQVMSRFGSLDRRLTIGHRCRIWRIAPRRGREGLPLYVVALLYAVDQNWMSRL